MIDTGLQHTGAELYQRLRDYLAYLHMSTAAEHSANTATPGKVVLGSISA
jgi:hypothetical protein